MGCSVVCRYALFTLLLGVVGPFTLAAQLPVVSETNVVIRLMSANITTGDNQRYEAPGLRIFQGLKPDIVAVQEFNYVSTNGAGLNTPNAFREMLNAGFGTNFVYFRETGYSIPNGIISRWPIRSSGSWVDDDAGVNDRGFAWACIDIPGTNDLYVVSVHLKASGGVSSAEATRRNNEAIQIKGLVQTYFSNEWVVVAGDLNTADRSEACVTTFKTFLSDSRVPVDQAGDDDTNAGRDNPYDYVLPGIAFATNQVPSIVGTRTFGNGLVFDSRLFNPLADVAPVLLGDSEAPSMQHMAVVKDFRVRYAVTNLVTVPAPSLVLTGTNQFRWQGLSNAAYTVQTSTTLTNWTSAGTVTSVNNQFRYTNHFPAAPGRFFRVTYP